MIMVTGGMGFLGASLAKLLCEQGHTILVTAHTQTELAPFLEPYRDKSLFVAHLDITDLEGVERTIRTYGIRSVIHAASVYEAKGSLYDAMRVNIVGTINILEASVRQRITRVTALSSEAVYQGIKQKEPLREEQLLHVESDRYIPGTKRAEENLAQLYGAKSDVEITLLRASRIYGPMMRLSAKTPISMMVRSAVEGKPADLSDIDEDEGHDSIYVKDCAAGVILAHTAGKLRNRVYNLGDGRLTTFRQVRDAVLKVYPDARITLGKNLGEVTATKSPLDINACLDVSRMSEELGYRPEYHIEEGVRAFVSWVRDGEYV